MERNPLSFFNEQDKDLFQAISTAKDLAFTDGALSTKHKLLTALALDASLGAVNGVRSLAQQALAAGATHAEILETLRVVYYISGVSCMYTAAQALGDIVKA